MEMDSSGPPSSLITDSPILFPESSMSSYDTQQMAAQRRAMQKYSEYVPPCSPVTLILA
jgi:hypothetical protein